MEDCNAISDEVLIAQLEHGDPVALTSLYKRHGRFLYSLALRITRDCHDAEEILQDTFLKLWRKSSHFDSARGSLIAWLVAITRNAAIDRTRQLDYRFQSNSLCEETLGGIETFFPNQYIAQQLVSAALSELPTAQREAITLAYFEGRTSEEIAARTGTPLGTIKTRLRTALRTMKASLSNPAFSMSSKHEQLPVMLENVLITRQLLTRTCRRRSSQVESNCFDILARVVRASPEQLVDSFLKMPIAVCRAGTAGLSLLEVSSDGEQIFRWTNLAGRLAKYAGGVTPRNFSPCGVTLDYESPQLFAYPGRYFHYFNDVDVPIVEGLVIPFRVGEHTEGTVWIVSHEEGRGFDSEDVRIMTGLAEVVGCALDLMRSEKITEHAQNEESKENGELVQNL